AMLLELAELRDDLSIVAMSATLDAQHFANLMNASVLDTPAVTYPHDVAALFKQFDELVTATVVQTSGVQHLSHISELDILTGHFNRVGKVNLWLLQLQLQISFFQSFVGFFPLTNNLSNVGWVCEHVIQRFLSDVSTSLTNHRQDFSDYPTTEALSLWLT